MGRLFWFFKRRVTGSCSALKSGRRKDVLDMFFFSFYCDRLRFSDILTLEWDSIDMDAQLLRKCQYDSAGSDCAAFSYGDGYTEAVVGATATICLQVVGPADRHD